MRWFGASGKFFLPSTMTVQCDEDVLDLLCYLRTGAYVYVGVYCGANLCLAYVFQVVWQCVRGC